MIPRIVIAGTHSDCGKTSIACGLMAALRGKGLEVQPFKVGPDFIDPSHHTGICGRASRNLDPFMMGEKGVLETFCRASAGADIAVIEGVMGMYDGLDGGDTGSTAHVARILDAPLLLVADVRGMSRSANALVRGYRDFDPGVRFAGVIFNRVGSLRHREMIEEELRVAAFGWIPWQKDLAVESRHLGLRMAFETAGMAQFGGLINEHCDLGAILEAARSAPAILPPDNGAGEEPGERVKIGVASDPAFCFYYQDNLDRLHSHGADLVFFSPINDHLPKVDGLYLGGGYPELYAQALEEGPARREIRQAIEAGMPTYGECGGLVYLARSISTDREYRMVGLLPARAFQHERFQALGYVSATCTAKSPFVPLGHTYQGHEFHYSSVQCDPDARFCLTLARGSGIGNGRDGISEANALAGYTHAYFTDIFARSFIRAAAAHTGLP